MSLRTRFWRWRYNALWRRAVSLSLLRAGVIDKRARALVRLHELGDLQEAE